MKTFLRSVAFAGLMVASAISQATEFNFSYVFTTGDVISGSFDGTANGNLITIDSDLAVSLDGTAFLGGRQVFFAGVTGMYAGGPAVVSFDGQANNFLAVDVLSGNSLLMAPFNGGATNVADYSAFGGGNADAPAESGGVGPYDPTRWTIAAVSAVPEPGTYAMFLAGLGLLGFLTKRRKRA